ncbi:MAG: tetratricopeptide repeat protein [Calditrichaeota bacterium]|nr:MAG: tetratricopeptide repeat protein [Calditrichota bacterium]
MKMLVTVVGVVSLSLLLTHCAGTGKVSSEDLSSMSPQQRIQVLTQKIQKEPNNVELRRQLFQDYLTVGLPDQAEAVLNDLLAIDPNQPDLLFQLGQAKFEHGDLKGAYRYFLQTLQAVGGDAYTPQIASYVSGKYMIQQVTSSPADEAFPSFSPDGKKLIYQIWQNGNWDIAELDLETDSTTILIDGPADQELPEYAPDGKTIAFTSNEYDRRPIDADLKSREIVLWEREGNYFTNLTQSVADDWLPRFSHDGKKILFVSDRSDLRKVNLTDRSSDIFIMDSNGDFQRPLTSTPYNEGGACFSPDDQHIYFHANKNGNYDIFVMKADGSQMMTIVDNPDGDDVNPYVSPDGEHLVFFSNRDGDYEIYMCRTDGTEQERLTFSPGKDLNPVFSPDGRTIAFHSNRAGNYDIYFLNLDMPASTMSSDQLMARLNELVNQ